MGNGKKILYVITKSSFGGAQRYVYDLATNLPKDKFEAVVALGGKGLLKEKLAQSGIRVISVPKLDRDIKFFDEFYVFYRLFRLFREEKPDVIHLNSSKIGGLGALSARVHNFLNLILNLLMPKAYPLRPARIIFTAHGWAFKEKRPLWQKMLIILASWITVKLSHKIIAVSENDLSKSPKIAVKSGKIICIKNGIGLPNLLEKDEARAILFARNSAPRDGYVIGTIAELHKNKGLSYMIESFLEIAKMDENPFLALIGEGEEKKNLQNMVKRLGLTKKVFFIGFVEKAENFLAAFDAFVLPSVKEGLPYTLLEAGLAGLPVVATSVGGIPEIIDDMETGILVRPRQPKELAGAVKFMIENRGKAAELGKNLSEKVRKEFSLERMVRETVALYS